MKVETRGHRAEKSALAASEQWSCSRLLQSRNLVNIFAEVNPIITEYLFHKPPEIQDVASWKIDCNLLAMK